MVATATHNHVGLHDDLFSIVRDVPVFAEHKADDGRVYRREDLEAIVETCNRRILDTGDFCPITLGHTPDSPDGEWPEIVGYAGPFKLSRIGNVNPRWAIVAEKWRIYRDKVDVARRYTRRSVEVWRDKQTGSMYFDPIAILGAETPRLDLGLVTYSRDGRERVGVYNAAFPSSTAMLPEQYSHGENGVENDAMDTLVSSVTPEMVMWIKKKMAEEINADNQAVADDSREEVAEYEADEEQAEAEEAAADEGPDGEEAPAAEASGEESSEPAAEEASDPDNEKKKEPEKMSATAQKKTPGVQPQRELVAKLSRVESENKNLRERLERVERDRRKEARYSRLQNLRASYVFDVDEEAETVAEFSDAQFERHCEKVVTKYTKSPVGASLPNAAATQAEPTQSEKLEAARKRVSRATELVKHARSKGESLAYEAALELAGKE